MNDPKRLFKLFHSVTGNDSSVGLLPYHDSERGLAVTFNNFFVNKIISLREKLPACMTPSSDFSNRFTGTRLCDFEPTNTAEIKKIISTSGIKCSQDDVLPSRLLANNLEVLLPYICTLVNLSLSTGLIDGVKLADIIPVLKNHACNP